MVRNSAAQIPALLLLLFLLFHQSDAADPQQGSPIYARFTFDATVFPPAAEYDYIVIGGGTAGCPLAATLSSAGRVLLLERGGAPAEFPSLATQDGFLRGLVDTGAPDSPTQAFTSEDGVANARGRVLGGSSAVNAGFYSRAHPGFFGGRRWDAAAVEASYRWVEAAVAFWPEITGWQMAVRDGLLEANVTPWNGFTVEHLAGTKIGASTFNASGWRHTAADLLNLANAGSIAVAMRATVERILLTALPGAHRRREQQQQAASGVVYRDRLGKQHRATVRGGGEVILSAGAIGSPQLLLLSGIGPRPYLSSLGIPVAVHSPGVGDRMVDNPRNGINIVPPAPLTRSLIQVVGIPAGPASSFIEAASTVVPFFPSPVSSAIARATPILVSVATIIEKVAQPASSGTLRLASLDPDDTPRVRFNYFADPGDLDRCAAGMRRIGAVLAGRSLDGFRVAAGWWRRPRRRVFRFMGPALPHNLTDVSAAREFCRRTVSTIWHYHGGCVVGQVVDGEYRVIGVAGLRVVDGSTFNVSPGTNPQATVMMMGRYVGLKMIEERRNRRARRSPRTPRHG